MGSGLVTAITSLAATQHGAISVKQLRQLGMSAKAQRGAVTRGWLILTAPSVLVLAGSEDTWERRLQVALLALDERGWISHESAARLHGLDRFDSDAVDVTGPRSVRGHGVPGTLHTTSVVGRLDLVTVSGFRCTSATRTVIDLARSGTAEARLEAAIDSAVRRGLSAPLVIERRLGELRGPGRNGARLLDRLLVDSGGETILERRFLRLVRDAGLPRPQTQAVQRRDGRQVARVDFLFAAAGVVVEVTGRVGHSSPADRDRDAQRRNELLDLGLRVYEYTWGHVSERSAWVAATLRRRLQSSMTANSARMGSPG